MADRRDNALTEALRLVTPGGPLREGLYRILQSQKGALVVVGDDLTVFDMCSGGFEIDVAMSSARLSELAKMDGAIVLSGDASRIVRANVQLMPDASIATDETGTRHRTAERVARATGLLVVAVSEEMSTITVYRGDRRRVLQDSTFLAARANRLLQILERFRIRLDEASTTLTAAEIAGLVTVREVAALLHRAEVVTRVAEQVRELIVELGQDGKLLDIQLAEAIDGVDEERRLTIEDYLDASDGWNADLAVQRLAELTLEELPDLAHVASVLGPGTWDGADLAGTVEARGFRLLYRVPHLTPDSVGRIVSHFPDLQKVLRATPAELAGVAGIAEEQAEAVKEGLARLAESSVLDRYN